MIPRRYTIKKLNAKYWVSVTDNKLNKTVYMHITDFNHINLQLPAYCKSAVETIWEIK